jgi:hypothetical protein
MAKIVICPHCSGEMTIETSKKTTGTSNGTRGMLQGIALVDMTIEQLRREKVNATSVLYKATQRNAAPELLAANAVRVEAVKAELAKRAPAPIPAAIAVSGTESLDLPTVDCTEVTESLSTDESIEALNELVNEN